MPDTRLAVLMLRQTIRNSEGSATAPSEKRREGEKRGLIQPIQLSRQRKGARTGDRNGKRNKGD